MITVDYNYYNNYYKGTLSENEFDKEVNIAYIVADNLTFNRLNNLSDTSIDELTLNKIKMCICTLCDRLSDENIGVGLKSSESVGSWAVSYAADTIPKSVLSSLNSVVNFYLGGTELTCSWI